MSARILLAEDEVIFRMDVKEMLEDAGYEVVAEASDGEQAIEYTLKYQPDLVIMDIKMPQVNGLKASKIIDQSFQTPVLILTAYSQEDFVKKAKQSNILGYLVKPISEANLLPAVEIALSQAERVKHYCKQIDMSEQKLADRKLIERAKGLLMKTSGISEDKAFEKMRSESMNRSQSLRDIARIVLSEYEKKKKVYHG